jgi:hypothetical protein
LTIQVDTSESGSNIDGFGYRKAKKIFKKNISCPFGHCSNKYSSRIALNSHLRVKHGRKWFLEV